MLTYRIAAAMFVVLIDCSTPDMYPGDPPPGVNACDWLTDQHASGPGVGMSFLGWLERNWPSHRFTYCATGGAGAVPVFLKLLSSS